MSKTTSTLPAEIDVLIVGAGLSGIGAARHLQMECPDKSFVIAEMRESLGGTWDIFRYPGVRSDSDMYTLGYKFKPWTNPKAIADGPDILSYLKETASETGVDQHICYGQKAVHASWSTDEARWTVTFENPKTGEQTLVKAKFCYGNTGYYNYDHGYEPEFPGIESYEGQIVQPQFWPEDLDYEGKKVVIIGSGATAVTILPAMTDKAEKVTMLQRTPTYMLTLPLVDPIARLLYKIGGEKTGYKLTRWKNATQTIAFYHFCKRFPGVARKLLMGGVARQVDGADVSVGKDFNPPYNPWDQRLCVIPSGDLFKSLREGKSEIVTDHIDTFTKTGIKLKSGKELEADIVITATGLDLVPLGGIDFDVDGQTGELSDMMVYRGCMATEVPNFIFTVGYTNASWTLKSDLVAEYACRLLNHMDENGYDVVVPRNDDPSVTPEPLLDFPAGYVLRAIEKFPKAGSRAPWKMRNTYHQDYLDFNRAAIEDGNLKFSKAKAASEKRQPVAA